MNNGLSIRPTSLIKAIVARCGEVLFVVFGQEGIKPDHRLNKAAPGCWNAVVEVFLARVEW